MSVPSAGRRAVRRIMRNRLIRLIAGISAFFAVTGIAVSLLTSSPATALPPAPAAAGFSVAALDESAQHVALSQYQGKPVIVNFWASWCTDCRTETPLLARWYQQQHGHVGLVGLDENDSTGKALAFAHANEVSYPVGFDPLTTAASAYGVAALPQTFFLNAAHHIVERVYGAVTKADLAQGVHLMNAAQAPGEKVIAP